MDNLIHGGDIYTKRAKWEGKIIDFSANINPLGLPKGVKSAIVEGLDLCENYPDPLCRELRKSISENESVDIQHILCGNGAADLIFRLVLAKKPKKALLLCPTFAEYELALESVGSQIEYYELKEEMGFAIEDDFIEYLHEGLEIVFLCNPNNPTGRLIHKELLENILKICKGLNVLLVIDECFIEFVEDWHNLTMAEYIKTTEELCILKAFTKNYAMPGLRLGYCLCSNQGLLAKMEKAGQPWNVSVVAQLAGVAALKEKGYLDRGRKLVENQKKYLTEKIQELNIKAYSSSANYILLKIEEIRTKEENEIFKESLISKGILIRDCSNYKGLEIGYYRIAIKGHEDNEKLIDAFKSIKEDMSWQRRL